MALFNNNIIHSFNNDLFKTLLYKQHLTTQAAKLVEFHQHSHSGRTEEEGYLFLKDNTKYLFPQRDQYGNDLLEELPIRVLDFEEIVLKNKDIVQWVKKHRSFRIKPLKVYDLKQLMTLDGITHPKPEMWEFLKLMAFVAYCRRINVVISGIAECGKTSSFSNVAMLTNQGYVVKQPRSVIGLGPGLIPQGFIAIDELGAMEADAKRMIATFMYQQGELELQFKTGKGKALAYHFDSIHDIHNLSCVVLCNLLEDYEARDSFFAYMFDNSQAINKRFFPIRLNKPHLSGAEHGQEYLASLLDTKQFKTSSETYTANVRDVFLGIIKSYEYYRDNWATEADYAMVDSQIPRHIKGRHYHSYREILAGFSIYAKLFENSPEKFSQLKGLLDQYHVWYKQALEEKYAEPVAQVTLEEVI